MKDSQIHHDPVQSHSLLGLKRFHPSVYERNRSSGEMEQQSIGYDVQPKKSGDRSGKGIVAKFGQGETWEMQANRQLAARNEDAANLCERRRNVHVGQSNSRNYAIETPVFEWQALAGPVQIGSVWKSLPRESQTAFVDVKSRDLIRCADAPRSQVQPRSAT